MLKKHTFWLKATIVFQLVSAAAHSLSFFVTPVPANETERQLLELMNNYKSDMGGGFSPSTQDLFTALSACFPLLYVLGASINWYLLRRKVDIITLKGVVSINIVVFGVSFVLMAMLTFLPPITLTGLVFLCLIISRLTFPKA